MTVISLNNSQKRAPTGTPTLPSALWILASLWVIAALSACGAVSPPAAPGAWQHRASMEEERSWIGLASVGGKLYAIGGMTGPLGDRLDSNEVYDPRANAWHFLSPMPTARSSPGAVAVGSQIYVLGGYPASGVSTVVEAYDIVRDVWRTGLSPMPTRRFDLAAVALDQIIYTFGGYDVGPMTIVEAYDTAKNRWQTLPSMPTARYALQAVMVDGKIWVMGGHTAAGPTDIVEVFDPATQRWSAGERLPEAMAGFGAAVGGGKLHIATFDTHFALDLVPGTTLSAPGTAALAAGGRVPAGQWSRLPPMLTSRHGLQLAYIDQYLFAVGGCMPGDGNLFDVAKNEAYLSTERSPHPVEREGPGAVALLAAVVVLAALLIPRLGAHA